MKAILSFTVIPMDAGESIANYVAACQRVLARHDVDFQLHANGTNVEGAWDEVFAAIKSCHETIHRMGSKRIFTTIQVGTRIDREQRMVDKVRAVEQVLARESS